MSFFNLRRLLPARKAWRKFFATKLQSKLLHKLYRPKSFKKKPNNRLKSTSTKKAVFWQTSPRREPKTRAVKVPTFFSHHRFHTRKRPPPPVYIDQLFVEHHVLKEHTPASEATSDREIHKISRDAILQTKLIGDEVSVPGRSKGNRNETADEMWESLVLASPQMHGINERAEEFITRIRAEMQLQEMSAHHL